MDEVLKVRMPKALLDALRERAEEQGMAASAWARQMLQIVVQDPTVVQREPVRTDHRPDDGPQPDLRVPTRDINEDPLTPAVSGPGLSTVARSNPQGLRCFRHPNDVPEADIRGRCKIHGITLLDPAGSDKRGVTFADKVKSWIKTQEYHRKIAQDSMNRGARPRDVLMPRPGTRAAERD